MNTSTTIRIDQTLYEQACADAVGEHRTIAGQIEYWARVARAALDNPDLPVGFIAETLASLVYLEAVGPHENFYRDLKRS